MGKVTGYLVDACLSTQIWSGVGGIGVGARFPICFWVYQAMLMLVNDVSVGIMGIKIISTISSADNVA